MIVVPYDAGWPRQFSALAADLCAVLEDSAGRIHHIGSTAVPGLVAKPVIDILVEAADLASIDRLTPRIEALGYEARGENGIPGRRYFRTAAGHAGREVHIHMFRRGAREIAAHLAFRDALRTDAALRERYAAMKLAISQIPGMTRKAYQERKSAEMAEAGLMETASKMTLASPLAAGEVRLELWDDRYREGLRAACARDPDIWEIYPISMLGEHFDRAVQAREAFHGARGWVPYVALKDGDVVGMTNYIDPDEANGVVEIGGTYIEPSVRGTDYNRTMKRLLIDHAFASGFTRIEFRVDARNARSMRAVEKLGVRHEGTLRKNRVTWTGYVRDTAVFGLLKAEWDGAKARPSD